MSIKINNFVDVILKHIEPSLNDSSRPITVLLDANATDTGYFSKNGSGEGSSADEPAKYDETDNWQKAYFDNGGQILHIVDSLTNLPTNEIIVTYKEDTSVSDLGEGVDEKIYIMPTTSTTVTNKLNGVVYKKVVEGKEYDIMTVAAYYSKIRAFNVDDVADYSFTAETVDEANLIDTNDDAQALGTAHINYDTYLAGSTRNIGGDDIEGNDLTNWYMRIVLCQTLSDSLLTLLASKIKYNATGINAVKNCVSCELDKYVNSGYIKPTAMWTEDDLYIDKKLWLTKDSPLISGYSIFISSFDTLTPDQKKAHQFPNIYIVYSEEYHIRKIVLRGTII